MTIKEQLERAVSAQGGLPARVFVKPRPHNDRVTVTVVTRAFRGMSDPDRQYLVHRAMRTHMSDADRWRVGSVLPYTPGEVRRLRKLRDARRAAAQAAATRPASANGTAHPTAPSGPTERTAG